LQRWRQLRGGNASGFGWRNALRFRGFVFQRLVDGLRPWIALAGLGLLFAMAHWNNPGMEGATRWLAAGSMASGGIMFGLAWLRTRSLALPVGIHLGWNWTQGHVLGFGVSGFDHNGWLQPLFQGQPQWLTGGEFGPEASLFASSSTQPRLHCCGSGKVLPMHRLARWWRAAGSGVGVDQLKPVSVSNQAP
jgi:hypothetical protein